MPQNSCRGRGGTPGGWSLPVGTSWQVGRSRGTSGGEELDTVEHVLQIPELDVFDGIVVTTAGGLRSADADQMADITDRYVVLVLPVEETERLGRPPAPAVCHADPSERAGGSLHDWFGRSHWKRDD
jgi:hypothetical protein